MLGVTGLAGVRTHSRCSSQNSPVHHAISSRARLPPHVFAFLLALPPGWATSPSFSSFTIRSVDAAALSRLLWLLSEDLDLLLRFISDARFVTTGILSIVVVKGEECVCSAKEVIYKFHVFFFLKLLYP